MAPDSRGSKGLKGCWLAAVMVVLLLGCGDDGTTIPDLGLSFSDPPIVLGDIRAAYAQDVIYGKDGKNTFDIYLPDSVDPTPLVIYIHGGGFTAGDKGDSHARLEEEILTFLEQGVAFATINYRLLTLEPTDQEGVIKSMTDCARALQFMRYHAAAFNIDPDLVALFGGSAGAGTSLWLGTHDDLANADSPDPVLRESTRVRAVGALATQSTYDILRWEEVLLPVLQVFEEAFGGTYIPTVAAAIGAEDYLLAFLGISGVEALDTQDVVAYRANVDMLDLMDAQDAPIYVQNGDTDFNDPLDTFLHHGLHAWAVKERADEVDLSCVAYVDDPDYLLVDPSGDTLVGFLLRHL